MKKEIISLCAWASLIVTSLILTINFVPNFSNSIRIFDFYIVSLSSPVDSYNKLSAKFSSYISQDVEDNSNTTSKVEKKKSEETMKRITTKDSDDNSSDITQVPDDIANLMSKAKKTIKKEKKKGATSEESYFGGGTLVSYKDIEVQNKIPTSFYDLNVEKLFKQGTDLKITDKSKPTILIYHSHTTESYSLLDVGYYTTSFDQRCKDTARNMVRVGDELVIWLEKAGFNVIHDTEIHDLDYNSSYDDSLKSIEKYLEQYPTIDITIDVHRDDITYNNNTKVKPTATILGKKAARMMLISGCEYGRVVNFPDWKENLKFDLQVQNAVNEMYGGLMRPILFSERRYNMNQTHYSFLLEVGTDANTLDEACYSARLFGNAFGKMLNEYCVEEK